MDLLWGITWANVYSHAENYLAESKYSVNVNISIYSQKFRDKEMYA